MVGGESEKKMKQTQSASNTLLNYFQKSPVTSSPKALEEKQHVDVLSDSDTPPQRKPGGWRAMPYILGLSSQSFHSFSRGVNFFLILKFFFIKGKQFKFEIIVPKIIVSPLYKASFSVFFG